MPLTELDIIKTILDNITYKGEVVKGIGDDCAVFKVGNIYLTVTTAHSIFTSMPISYIYFSAKSLYMRK